MMIAIDRPEKWNTAMAHNGPPGALAPLARSVRPGRLCQYRQRSAWCEPQRIDAVPGVCLRMDCYQTDSRPSLSIFIYLWMLWNDPFDFFLMKCWMNWIDLVECLTAEKIRLLPVASSMPVTIPATQVNKPTTEATRWAAARGVSR